MAEGRPGATDLQPVSLNGLAVVGRRTFGDEGRAAFAAECRTKAFVGRTFRAAARFVQSEPAEKGALGLTAALPLFPGDDDVRRFHLRPPSSSPGTPAGTAHDDETVSLFGEQSRDETRKLERALKQVLRCENIRFCGFDVHGVRDFRSRPREGCWPVRGATMRMIAHGRGRGKRPRGASAGGGCRRRASRTCALAGGGALC